MSWIRQLFSRHRLYGELSEEIRAHLEEKIDELVAGGMSREAAAAAARCEFGNVTLIEERGRDVWRWPSIDDFVRDIRFGLRMFRKNPGFTAIAVLTLALGIGANTAIFSVLDAVLLRSLPVADPGQLVLLTDPDSHGHSLGDESGDRTLLSYAEFEYLRDHTNVFSGIFAADSVLPQVPWGIGNSASATRETETARVRLVSGDYFSTLKVRTAAGRTFTSEADRARGAAPMAVLSYSFWKQRLGLDPSVVGMTIRIRQTPFTVIGVAAPGFFGETVGDAPDIWIPLTMQDAVYPGRDLLSLVPGMLDQYLWLQVMARLGPEVNAGQAAAQVNIVFKRLRESQVGPALTAEQRRSFFNEQIKIQPGARGPSTLHEDFGDPIKLLMCLVGLILLIACANIANLLLARGTVRQREFAVRLAVGGGRFRLITQLLTESLLLALLGAALGVLLAQWADRLLLRMASGVSTGSAWSRSFELNLQPDLRILGFTTAVAVLAALIFGLVPALRATRMDVSPVLKSTTSKAAGASSPHRLSAGKLLVVAQLTVSLILLVAAGLFVHSLERLGSVSLGYNRENLVLFRIDAALAGYNGPSSRVLFQNLLDKFSAIPGVHAATLSTDGLFQNSESGDPVDVEGYTPRQGEEMHSRFDHIGPGYFSTVGIPLLLGREIGPHDGGNGPRAAVINQAFAQTYFPNSNPIGRKVRDRYPGNPGDAEVVGVAANAKANSLRERPRPRLYVPFFNPIWEHTDVSFQVRTSSDPALIAAALRNAVQETDPALEPGRFQTMSELVDDSLNTERFIARLSGAFGLLAMLLASIGLYGVMAYTVAARTREIGVRMALGAPGTAILQAILRETVGLLAAGIALGVPLAVAGTRFIRSMLFGMELLDPVALALAIIVLAAIALLAGLLPARRASRIDPVVALRCE